MCQKLTGSVVNNGILGQMYIIEINGVNPAAKWEIGPITGREAPSSARFFALVSRAGTEPRAIPAFHGQMLALR